MNPDHDRCRCEKPSAVRGVDGYHLRRLDSRSAFDLWWSREIRTARFRRLSEDELRRMEDRCKAIAAHYVGVTVVDSVCPAYKAAVEAERARKATDKAAAEARTPKRGSSRRGA